MVVAIMWEMGLNIFEWHVSQLVFEAPEKTMRWAQKGEPIQWEMALNIFEWRLSLLAIAGKAGRVIHFFTVLAV